MAVLETTRACPECRERIKIGATRCKYCGAEISPKKQAGRPLSKRVNNFRFGFITGVLFTAVLVVLIYYQFFAVQ